MWAAPLLTLQANTSVDITFNFRNTSNYVGLKRFEVVLFNCPQWGISVQSIRIKGTTPPSNHKTLISIHNPTLTSCESLLAICLSQTISSLVTIVTLQFVTEPGTSWVHLAEVSFYAQHGHCPPDGQVPVVGTERATTFTTPSATTSSVTSTHTGRSYFTSECALLFPCFYADEVTTDTTAYSLPATVSTTSNDHVIHLGACDSCCPCSTTDTILSPVLSAIAAALLAIVLSVTVQIAVCKCRRKSRIEKLQMHSVDASSHIYAEVDEEKKYKDPTYAEIGKSAEMIIDNEAYGILK